MPKRPVLCLAVLILLGLQSAPLIAQQNPATTPAPRVVDWWFTRHGRNIRDMNKDQPQLLMVGDSITQAWDSEIWQKLYAPRKAINLGFSGDRTQHVLWRLDHLPTHKVKPKAAVVMIGTNNTSSDSPEQIAQGITAVVQKLRSTWPDMNILLLAVFPRGQDDSDNRRIKIMQINQTIAQLHDGQRVFYLDIGEKFLNPDRTNNDTIMPDKLHLSPEGYRIWGEAVEPTLSQWLPLPQPQPASP